MKNILSIFIFLLAINAIAQNPVPAKPQTKRVILFGGTAHLGNGTVIQRSVLIFENGKLTAVGDATTVRINREGADYFDVSGKHVYPGLVSLANHVGLADIESIPAVNDYEETGSINPNVRALIAYNADSEIIPTVRGNGILISQAVPEGGVVTGQSSVFEMEGWNWQDAVLKVDEGICLNWPSFLSRQFNVETFSFSTIRNEQRNRVLQELNKTSGNATSLPIESDFEKV